MHDLEFKQFLMSQSSFPKEQATDKYYFGICEKLLRLIDESHLLDDYHPALRARIAICLTGYYQDVISDAGPWHAFITECQHLYGWYVPYYTDEDYMPYELNLSDVRFVVWYVAAMYSDKHLAAPWDDRFLSLGRILYDELERAYDESPMPEGYVFGRELELHDPEDTETIYELANWLFLHCYLMTPAFAMTLGEIMKDAKDTDNLHTILEQAMAEAPTGPLALYISEWVRLIVTSKPLPEEGVKRAPDEHHMYTAFVASTGGKEIAYFGDYDSLNRFFIDGMHWGENEEHLPQLKGYDGFVAMADRHRGLLVAKGVARCIADPENPYYNKEYASRHAIELLTKRGLCPHDLLIKILDNGWLPDARFEGQEDAAKLDPYKDFTARLYLQQYYRGD